MRVMHAHVPVPVPVTVDVDADLDLDLNVLSVFEMYVCVYFQTDVCFSGRMCGISQTHERSLNVAVCIVLLSVTQKVGRSHMIPKWGSLI